MDIGDATNFPAGYALGDEVLISATHADSTRSWRRRVRGSELEQDVHFTHGTWRGAMRKAKLISNDILTDNSTPSVTLRDSNTRAALNVRINGELQDEDTWTFTKPATIAFDEALSSSDIVEVERVLYRDIDTAKEAIVYDGDAPVRNAMARYYPSPLGDRVPELQDLSEALAASALRHMLYSGRDRVDDEAANLWKGSQSMLSELRKGERSLTDARGAYIAPTAKSTTTPNSSVSVTRRQNRFTDENERVDI